MLSNARLRAAVGALLVFAVTVFFFSPSFDYSLANYDDHEYVVENQDLKNGFTLQGVRWAFRSCGYAANWHPLCWMSLMFDVSVARRLGGMGEHFGWMRRALVKNFQGKEWTAYDGHVARVMHVHNVILHGLNAALLFFLLQCLLSREILEIAPRSGSLQSLACCALAALFWALHPLRCEIVCWVSERKELLCVLFMLLSMLFYFLPFRREAELNQTKDTCPRSSPFVWLSALLFFSLALFSKPLAVSLPVVFLVWDLVICKRRFWRAVFRTTPFFLLSLVVCAITMVAQQTAMATRINQPYVPRISMALKAPLVYLRQTVLPTNLSFFYCLEDKMDWVWAPVGLIFLGGIVYLCVRWLRQRERWCAVCTFGVAWCYVGLIPMLGIVKVGNQPHSDRYTYWVGMGLVVVTSWLLTMVLRRFRNVRLETVVKVMAVVVAVYAIAGWRRMPTWRDPVCLMGDGYRKSRAFVDVADRYAWILNRLGENEPAEAVLRESVAEWPCAKAFAQLAYYLTVKSSRSYNDLDESRYFAQKALDCDENTPLAYLTLIRVCLGEGDPVEALKHCETALSKGVKGEKFAELLPELKKEASAKPPGWKKPAREIWQ